MQPLTSLLARAFKYKQKTAGNLDRISIQDKLDNCVSKEDWAEFVAYVSSAYLCKDDFVTSIIALSEKVDAAKAAIKALADKLDSEDVSNLDTDYRVAVDAVIK